MPLALSLLRRQGKGCGMHCYGGLLGPRGEAAFGTSNIMRIALPVPTDLCRKEKKKERWNFGEVEEGEGTAAGGGSQSKVLLVKITFGDPFPLLPTFCPPFPSPPPPTPKSLLFNFPVSGLPMPPPPPMSTQNSFMFATFPNAPVSRDGSFLLVERRQNPSDQVSRSTFAGATWIEGEGERDLSSHQDVGEEDERKGSWLGDFGKEKGGSGILA